MLVPSDADCADFHARAFGIAHPLKIGVFAAFAGRVKLRRANAVAVAARHEGPFITDNALFGHSSLYSLDMLA